jgi:hypothetical protein
MQRLLLKSSGQLLATTTKQHRFFASSLQTGSAAALHTTSSSFTTSSSSPPPPPPRTLSSSSTTTTRRPFHTSRSLNEWHERFDPGTGQYYYEDIYTKEIQTEKPDEYLAHGHADSKLMRFLMTDSTKDRDTPPGVKYFAVFALVLGVLFAYDQYNPPGERTKRKKKENVDAMRRTERRAAAVAASKRAEAESRRAGAGA